MTRRGEFDIIEEHVLWQYMDRKLAIRVSVVKEIIFPYVLFHCSDFQHVPLLLTSGYMETFIFQ